MSEKTKKIQLEKPMTWAGVNYAPGENTMPEAAAKSAVNRKFGSYADKKESDAGDFLSLEETQKRFSEGDLSDQVVASLRHHKETLFSNVPGSKSKTDDPENKLKGNSGDSEDGNSKASGNGGADDKKTKEPPPEIKLPEDFPMHHVFEKLGFKSVKEVQSKTREELIALDGIAEKSADAALIYGK